MKTTAAFCILLILSAISTQAKEAWYLEMDSKYSEALLEKYAAEDKEPYRKVLALLPSLISSGKIQEIEKISMAETEKGGTHFPRKIGKLPEADEVEFELGSSYSIMNDNQLRYFQITTRRTVIEYLTIGSVGDLPQEWMPTFVLKHGKTVKILLEKDLEATAEFFQLKSKLSFTTTIPETFSATWLINDDLQKKISSGKFKPTETFSYHNTEAFFHEDVQEVRQTGHSIEWKLTPAETHAVEWSHTKLITRQRYMHDVYEVKAEITTPGEVFKAPVIFHRDAYENGKFEISNVSTKGEAEYGLK